MLPGFARRFLLFDTKSPSRSVSGDCYERIIAREWRASCSLGNKLLLLRPAASAHRCYQSHRLLSSHVISRALPDFPARYSQVEVDIAISERPAGRLRIMKARRSAN
jgi:hypothetical protein